MRLKGQSILFGFREYFRALPFKVDGENNCFHARSISRELNYESNFSYNKTSFNGLSVAGQSKCLEAGLPVLFGTQYLQIG